ncbi:unnamed protein product [Microthlaspi erraticum]|uniref:Uncharacterized protein n=1 Tax=Microthlaspi erraticum TaxID=1685480 RepID=A0A6D2HCP1_9BRAS|nr:unnamed protein product [Microthlaspi erraticum]
MEFHGMKRKKLQSLCKKHGIPANLKNIEMASRLASLFQKETQKAAEVIDLEEIEDEDVERRFKPLVEIYNREDCSRAQDVARLGENVNVPLVDERVKAPRKSRKLGKSVSELLLVDETITRRKKQESASSLGNIALRKLLVEHAQFDQEEEEGGVVNVVEASGFYKNGETCRYFTKKKHSKVELGTFGRRGEEKHEDDTVLMAEVKDKEEEASSLPVPLIHEAEIFEETTPPPTSVHLSVKNPEAVSTGQILVKDIGDEDIEAKEEIFVSIPGSELKKHNLEAKLAEAEAACCNEIHSSKDEMKVLSQPVTMSKAACSILDESEVFVTPEGRNLMLMEQENGKTSAADSVTHHDDEAAESHAVVFTIPEKVSLVADSGLDDVGKEEEHTATEPDVLTDEARNEGESVAVELHEESDIATSPLRQLSGVRDIKGDGIEWKEENGFVELTCISPDSHALLGKFESDGAEKSGGNKDKASEGKAAAEFHDESAVPEEAAKCEGNRVVELQVDCDVFTSAEKHLLLETAEGDSIKDKEEASSSLPVLLTERLDVSIHEAEIFEETTPPPTSVHFAVSNPEAVSAGHILVKEHNLVAKLAEAEASVEISAVCCNEIHEPGESSSSETKAAESVLIIENVLEGECEEKLELGTVLFEEEKEQVPSLLLERLSPASVKLAITSPAAELVVRTGRILLKDIASTMSVEEVTNTQDETLICTPRSELKEHYSVAKLAKVEANLENSAASCNENHSSKDDEKGSLENVFQEEKLQGSFSECSVEEQADTCKVGRISLEHCVDLETMDEVSPMEENVSDCVKEGGRKTVLAEVMKVEESHELSGVLTASESHSLMRVFEPEEAENKYKENKVVELLSESNISINLEKQLVSVDSGLDGTIMIKDHTGATSCEESFGFTSPERNQLSGNTEPHTVGKQEQKEVDSRLLLGESGQDRLGHGKSGSSEYQSHHGSSVSRKTCVLGGTEDKHQGDHSKEDEATGAITLTTPFEKAISLTPKEFTTEDNTNEEDATKATAKQSRGHSPHVYSLNLFDFDAVGTKTATETERNVGLPLPAEVDSETIGEISSHLEVAGTCSVVSEESAPFTDIQSQINDDALEEMEITGDYNISLFNTFSILTEKDSSLDLDESTLHNHKDEQVKAITLTPDEITVQDNMIEKAADEEMIENIDETEKQVGGDDPILIYRTEVKPKWHDMKENAPSSKIVDHLNVTARRTSKRQPLKDLRNN